MYSEIDENVRTRIT